MPNTSPTDQSQTFSISLPARDFMPQTATAFPLTAHARRRRQQRSVSLPAIELVCWYGKSIPAGDGCRRNVLTERDAAWLMVEGEPVQNIEDARRIVVITSEEGAVVTCYVEGQRPALRRIRHKRKGPRSRRR